MMCQIREGVFLLVVLGMLAGTNGAGDDSDDVAVNPSVLAQVAKGNTRFAGDLYTALRQIPALSNKNLVCSPLSLSTVIAMVHAGAHGETSNQIETALHFPTEPEDIYNGYRALLASLKSNDNFTLEIANRVYVNTGFKLNSSYTSIVKNFFGAGVEQLDFSNGASSASKINKWVEGVTRNKIKDLISSSALNSLTRLVLINGIYFKGKWKTQFKKELTDKEKFFITSQNPVEVDMMEMKDDISYADIPDLEARAVSLPYLGDRLSLILILPNEIDGIAKMESLLAKYDISKLPTLFRTRKVHLKLPRFKIESTLDLQVPLSKLGLTSMFDEGRADFSGIPNDPTDRLVVSQVIQKAFIEVNEEGSEAAAASGIKITLKSAVIRKEFNVNHPFISMIYDGETQTILFMTTLVVPSQDLEDVTHPSINYGSHLNATNGGYHPRSTLGLLSLVIPLMTFWWA